MTEKQLRIAYIILAIIMIVVVVGLTATGVIK